MRLHTSELYIPLPLAHRPNDCAIVRSPFLSLSGRYTLNAPAISLLRGRRAREQLELHGRRSAEKEMRSRSAERPGRLRFEDPFFFSFFASGRESFNVRLSRRSCGTRVCIFSFVLWRIPTRELSWRA